MRAGSGDGSVELTRDLGFWDVTLIGVGAMIGAGIFVLVGSAAGHAGPALVLAFVINGIVAVLTALVYAELGSAIPSAGGSYIFIRQALPALFGFMAGWMSWFAHAVAGSLYALGFGSFTVEILRVGGIELTRWGVFAGMAAHTPAVLLGILVGLFFFYINFRGASETGLAGAVVTVAKIAVILVFVGGGLWVLLRNPERLATFQPFAPNGLGGVFLAMGITYVAFEGFEVIVQAGEEVKDPKRTIPRAVITAMIIVIPIYLLVSITLLGAIDPPPGEPNTWTWLGQVKELGLARAAEQVVPYGNLVILVGGLLSTMSALNATTFSSTRVSFAMGRDHFLPPIFGRIHRTTRTPHVALGATGALILFMLVALPLESVAAAASLMFLLLFLMVNLSSVFIRRRFGDKLAYGYLTPFFPAVPVLAVLIQLVLVRHMLHFGADVLVTAVVWLGLGATVYVTYSRHQKHAKIPTPVVVEERPVLEYSYAAPPVVLPLALPQGAEHLIRTAAGLAKLMDRRVLMLHVVTVPGQLPLRAGNELVPDARDEMQNALDLARSEGVDAEMLIRLAHDASVAMVKTLDASDADFCVLGWRRVSRGPNRILGSNLDRVLREANCNFVVMQEPRGRVDRILLPTSNPDQGPLALAVSYALARTLEASHIDVLTLFPKRATDEAVDNFMPQMAAAFSESADIDLGPWSDWRTPMSLNGIQISLRPLRTDSTMDELEAQSLDYDLMVLGAGPGGLLGREVLGRFTWTLANRSACPVVAVRWRAAPLRFQVQSFFDFFRDDGEPVVGGPEDVSRGAS
ncbi:MAG: amino acid permease [Gemmatimonadota bacterium]|jgi:amino acid transporter/nucleotide-binding universal stress UspA family protein